ncbi:MAG TPA: hypothetical protein VFO41_03700 [Alphaproteobacteria bacterium]|nr:hypothetical protein [Alphaproteobacteria bacterium]
MIGLVVALALVVQNAALRNGPVAVIFPPHFSMLRMADAVARAHGTLVRGGGLPGVLVARSDDQDFSDRLHRQGALLVLDPIVAAACLPQEPH